jgi:hypothetical protein
MYIHGVGSSHWKRLMISAVTPHPPTTASQPKTIHLWLSRLIIRRPNVPDSLQQKTEAMNKVLAAYWLYTRRLGQFFCPRLCGLWLIYTLKNVTISLGSSLLAGFPSPLSHSMNVAIDCPIARTCRFAQKHTMVRNAVS